MPATAYAQIRAIKPALWGERRLAAGDPVLDLRAPGGAKDLATFRSLLRWSAFAIVDLPAPPPAPEPAPADPADTTAPIDRLAALLRDLPADQLIALPGLGAKSVEKLKAWAESPAGTDHTDA